MNISGTFLLLDLAIKLRVTSLTLLFMIQAVKLISFLFRNLWEANWILNSISFSHGSTVKVTCFSKILLSTLFMRVT